MTGANEDKMDEMLQEDQKRFFDRDVMIMTLYYEKLFSINAKNTKNVNVVKKNFKEEIKKRVIARFGEKYPKSFGSYVARLKAIAIRSYNSHKTLNRLSPLEQIIIKNEKPETVQGLQVEPLGLDDIVVDANIISIEAANQEVRTNENEDVDVSVIEDGSTTQTVPQQSTSKVPESTLDDGESEPENVDPEISIKKRTINVKQTNLSSSAIIKNEAFISLSGFYRQLTQNAKEQHEKQMEVMKKQIEMLEEQTRLYKLQADKVEGKMNNQSSSTSKNDECI